jgi:hypothetical protein
MKNFPHLVAHHIHVCALETGLFTQCWRDAENELRQGFPADSKPPMNITRREFTIMAGAAVLPGLQASSSQAKPKSISLVLAPSNLGLRPTESGGEPCAWRASQALMDAGLARALDVEETARLEKLVEAIQ